jgi:hypothetical protein
MARRNQPPNQLPEEIRDHPEVVRACREWNVGRLFRVINNLTEEPSKFTVTHIGRLCGLTTSRVVEYMKTCTKSHPLLSWSALRMACIFAVHFLDSRRGFGKARLRACPHRRPGQRLLYHP